MAQQFCDVQYTFHIEYDDKETTAEEAIAKISKQLNDIYVDGALVLTNESLSK